MSSLSPSQLSYIDCIIVSGNNAASNRSEMNKRKHNDLPLNKKRSPIKHILGNKDQTEIDNKSFKKGNESSLKKLSGGKFVTSVQRNIWKVEVNNSNCSEEPPKKKKKISKSGKNLSVMYNSELVQHNVDCSMSSSISDSMDGTCLNKNNTSDIYIGSRSKSIKNPGSSPKIKNSNDIQSHTFSNDSDSTTDIYIKNNDSSETQIISESSTPSDLKPDFAGNVKVLTEQYSEVGLEKSENNLVCESLLETEKSTENLISQKTNVKNSSIFANQLADTTIDDGIQDYSLVNKQNKVLTPQISNIPSQENKFVNDYCKSPENSLKKQITFSNNSTKDRNLRKYLEYDFKTTNSQEIKLTEEHIRHINEISPLKHKKFRKESTNAANDSIDNDTIGNTVNNLFKTPIKETNFIKSFYETEMNVNWSEPSELSKTIGIQKKILKEQSNINTNNLVRNESDTNKENHQCNILKVNKILSDKDIDIEYHAEKLILKNKNNENIIYINNSNLEPELKNILYKISVGKESSRLEDLIKEDEIIDNFKKSLRLLFKNEHDLTKQGNIINTSTSILKSNSESIEVPNECSEDNNFQSDNISNDLPDSDTVELDMFTKISPLKKKEFKIIETNNIDIRDELLLRALNLVHSNFESPTISEEILNQHLINETLSECSEKYEIEPLPHLQNKSFKHIESNKININADLFSEEQDLVQGDLETSLTSSKEILNQDFSNDTLPEHSQKDATKHLSPLKQKRFKHIEPVKINTAPELSSTVNDFGFGNLEVCPAFSEQAISQNFNNEILHNHSKDNATNYKNNTEEYVIQMESQLSLDDPKKSICDKRLKLTKPSNLKTEITIPVCDGIENTRNRQKLPIFEENTQSTLDSDTDICSDTNNKSNLNNKNVSSNSMIESDTLECESANRLAKVIANNVDENTMINEDLPHEHMNETNCNNQSTPNYNTKHTANMNSHEIKELKTYDKIKSTPKVSLQEPSSNNKNNKCDDNYETEPDPSHIDMEILISDTVNTVCKKVITEEKSFDSDSDIYINHNYKFEKLHEHPQYNNTASIGSSEKSVNKYKKNNKVNRVKNNSVIIKNKKVSTKPTLSSSSSDEEIFRQNPYLVSSDSTLDSDNSSSILEKNRNNLLCNTLNKSSKLASRNNKANNVKQLAIKTTSITNEKDLNKHISVDKSINGVSTRDLIISKILNETYCEIHGNMKKQKNVKTSKENKIKSKKIYNRHKHISHNTNKKRTHSERNIKKDLEVETILLDSDDDDHQFLHEPYNKNPLLCSSTPIPQQKFEKFKGLETKKNSHYFSKTTMSTHKKSDQSSRSHFEPSALSRESIKEIELSIVSSEDEHEKAKELFIDIYWTPPKLHTIDFDYSFTSITKLKKILGETEAISLIPFTEDEEEKIKRNWDKFSKMYGFYNSNLFTSTNKFEKYISPIERRKFLQFLARGLPDRRLHSVHAKFKSFFSNHRRKRSTLIENKILIGINRLYKNPNEYNFFHSKLLPTILDRHPHYIKQKLNSLMKDTKIKESVQNRVDWTPELESKMVYYLLTNSEVDSVEDLRNNTLSYEVWSQVIHELDLPIYQVIDYWRYNLYPRLFSRNPVMCPALYIQLIEWIHDANIKEWEEVDWEKLSNQMEGIGSYFLCKTLRSLVINYVPYQRHHIFRSCIRFLHLYCVPFMKNIRSQRVLKRVYYNEATRQLEDIVDLIGSSDEEASE